MGGKRRESGLRALRRGAALGLALGLALRLMHVKKAA